MGSSGHSIVRLREVSLVFEPESLKVMEILRSVSAPGPCTPPVFSSLGTSINDHQIFARGKTREV